MTLHAIAYVSTATRRQATSSAIDDLLAGARQFNESCGVTGALLHHGGNFFQYIEGPPEGVTRVYDRIRRSAGHRDLVELLNGPVTQRCFTTWAMGFAEPTTTELQRIAQSSWAEQLGRINNQPTESPGLALLLDFWARSRGAA